MVNKSRIVFFALIFSLMISLMSPYKVAAANIYVTHTYDGYDQNQENYCTLRMAIVAANENRKVGRCAAGSATEPDMIFLSPGTYQLDRVGDDALVCTEADKAANNCYYGDLDITESLSISGATPGSVTIQGSILFNRIFHINTSGSVKLTNLIVKNGDAPTSERGNSNPKIGGGIYNQKGTLTIDHSVIENNLASSGGGVANGAEGTLIITHSIIKDNQARNAAGILNDNKLYISNSLIYKNVAIEYGGGLINNSNTGEGVLTNVTFSKNTSQEGSALFSQSNLKIINNTIVGNTGGFALDISGTGYITNSIVVDNEGGNCNVYASIFYSAGYNLFDQPGCSIAITTDIIVDEPDVTKLIGTMDYENKGETMYVLPEGSPAINAGTNDGCASHDQRGIFFIRPRSSSDVCDIGSYEISAEYSAQKIFLPTVKR